MLHNFLGLLFVVMCLSGPAKAHPHVFVDARTGLTSGPVLLSCSIMDGVLVDYPSGIALVPTIIDA